MNLPSPKIETIQGIKVVRDDLILGGTKVRALPVLLKGNDSFSYASPASGYAQAAIAVVCKLMRKRCQIHVPKRTKETKPTKLAREHGAEVINHVPGYLSVCEARAVRLAEQSGYTVLPFGLDDPRFIEALADIASSMPVHPDEVWSVAGSGVLQRALQLAWPRARFFAVQIGKVPDAGRADVHIAPEKFEQPAAVQPPFPSVDYYDAKAWAFVKKHATKGALFWNVAG